MSKPSNKDKNAKNPWLKFFPTDWQADPKLRLCSLAARGFWLELVLLMHQADPYGHLLVNGKPPTTRQLAILASALPQEVESSLAELEEAGVFSRNEHGVIFSRRMVREEIRNQKLRENGAKGGNPNLKKPAQDNSLDNQPHNLLDNQDDNQLDNQGHNQPLNPPDNQQDNPSDNQPLNPGVILSRTRVQKPEARSQKLEERTHKPDLDKNNIPDGISQKKSSEALCEEMITVWNDTVHQNPQHPIQLSSHRKPKLKKRMQEFFKNDIGNWRAFCEQVKGTPFLMGENERGWHVDIDWVLEPRNITKILEGSYRRFQPTTLEPLGENNHGTANHSAGKNRAKTAHDAFTEAAINILAKQSEN